MAQAQFSCPQDSIVGVIRLAAALPMIDAIVQAIWIGMDRYWNLSGFHPSWIAGHSDEEKAGNLQLFQGSDKVYNDLAGLEGEQVSRRTTAIKWEYGQYGVHCTGYPILRISVRWTGEYCCQAYYSQRRC